MKATKKVQTFGLALGLVLLFGRGAAATIYNWQTGEVIPGTEGITPQPGVDLSYWNTSSHNLWYGDFRSTDLSGSWFDYSWLNHAHFGGAKLTGACLRYATLLLADLSGADLTWAILWNATLREANLTGADLTHADLYQASLSEACLWHANLTMAHLEQATLSEANLSGAILTGAKLSGAYLGYANLSGATLTSADLYQARLPVANLSGANLLWADLTSAYLSEATLTGANLTNATVKGANFGYTTFSGFTKEQLYSTASWKAKDLTGIVLRGNNLSGWNLAGQNLTSAYLDSATLTGANLISANLTSATLTSADLTLADLRKAQGASLGAAITRNTILPDGTVAGLNLLAGDTLIVRNCDLAVAVQSAMTLAQGSEMEFLLDNVWGSTVTAAAGVVPDLGGTLYLGFADGLDPWTLVGQTFDIFNWTEPLGAGNRFDDVRSESWASWDLGALYTTGDVTLVAVPEPATLSLLALGGLAVLGRRSRSKESIGRAP
jgi:uncharacterized protein YjbI with pentapeptide repeats